MAAEFSKPVQLKAETESFWFFFKFSFGNRRISPADLLFSQNNNFRICFEHWKIICSHLENHLKCKSLSWRFFHFSVSFLISRLFLSKSTFLGIENSRQKVAKFHLITVESLSACRYWIAQEKNRQIFSKTVFYYLFTRKECKK